MLADGNQTGNERLIEWWRFDRMSTVYRGPGRVTASFAAVAKLYGVGVDISARPATATASGVVEGK